MKEKLICIRDEDDTPFRRMGNNSNLCCWHLLLDIIKKTFKSVTNDHNHFNLYYFSYLNSYRLYFIIQ